MTINSEEIEIKLLFPIEKLKEIEEFVTAKGGTRRQRLQAAYIDTPEFLLTQAGVAFRLRKEGRSWIQTLKASSSNLLERLEHNVVIPTPKSGLPLWDIALHHDHQAGKLLKKLIKSEEDQLKVVYQTDIWRRKALVQTQSGNVEYALDCGMIYSENLNGLVKVPVLELEIELKSGSPQDLILEAKKCVQNFDAYIDTRSKSERGVLLASGLQARPPQKTRPPYLKKVTTSLGIKCALIDSCLYQILGNQSQINLGLDNYSEYLHQLRIGLRRLKVVLRHLKGHDSELTPESLSQFKTAFKELGNYRDNNFVIGFLNPVLLAHDGPEVCISSPALPNPSYITRDRGFQKLILEVMLIGMSNSYQETNATHQERHQNNHKEFISEVQSSLIKTYKNISEKVARFDLLGDEEIHAIRKQMKFIRYSLEFFRDYLNKKNYDEFYKGITTSLEHFGFYNDICVAIVKIDESLSSDQKLLFALGWLKAEKDRVKILCKKSAKSLLKFSIPW